MKNDQSFQWFSIAETIFQIRGDFFATGYTHLLDMCKMQQMKVPLSLTEQTTEKNHDYQQRSGEYTRTGGREKEESLCNISLQQPPKSLFLFSPREIFLTYGESEAFSVRPSSLAFTDFLIYL